MKEIIGMDSTTNAAFDALSRGFQPIPIKPRDKAPVGGGWEKRHWPEGTSQADIDTVWTEAHSGYDDDQMVNVGVLLGAPSNRLIDIDLDHPATKRLKDIFLPPTKARSGRPGKPSSHYWYIAKGEVGDALPGTRQYLMPRTPEGKRGAVIVEFRSTGGQTVIPPSIHPSGEAYMWMGEHPFGGDKGPAVVDGRVLSVQVALLALAAVLQQTWPTEGSRHEAYLALAGGLLRMGDQVHPFWGDRGNAAVLIGALAEATLDDDGPEARISEAIHTTISGLKNGKPVTGFPKLAEILGDKAVDQIRALVQEVESLAGVMSRQAPQMPAAADTSPAAADSAQRVLDKIAERNERLGDLPAEERDPLEERLSTWETLDLEPYLTGQVTPVMPAVMEREDGQHLMYPGRVNMLYGSSESAKSWIALYVCIQEMNKGERVMYLDLEDEPVNTLSRMQLLGAAADDLRLRFSYVRPEDPLEPMQLNRWGQAIATDKGRENWNVFQRALEEKDPTLIVLDGMTVLYGLHGLDTNDASSTEIITGWAKRLTRNGRSTVIIIDHTSKGSERGMTPIGSQHKQAMVQGTMLQVWVSRQPVPGQLGELELLVMKDRPGQVRANSVQTGVKMQTAARVTLDSTVPGTSVMRIQVPQTSLQQANSGVMNLQNVRTTAADRKREELNKAKDQVLFAFGGDLGKRLTKRQIADETGLGEAQVTSALEALTDQNGTPWLERHGNTKGTEYELIVGGGGYDISIDLSSDLTD
jgi:hypothetical protein